MGFGKYISKMEAISRLIRYIEECRRESLPGICDLVFDTKSEFFWSPRPELAVRAADQYKNTFGPLPPVEAEGKRIPIRSVQDALINQVIVAEEQMFTTLFCEVFKVRCSLVQVDGDEALRVEATEAYIGALGNLDPDPSAERFALSILCRSSRKLLVFLKGMIERGDLSTADLPNDFEELATLMADLTKELENSSKLVGDMFWVRERPKLDALLKRRT